MIKQAIAIGKARFKQVNTPVTNSALLELGFTRIGNAFSMGDLNITLIEGYHYYINKAGKYTRIKNMYTIAKLIYGNLEYGG